MKKVLVLSALGCIATVGAVFAAFTLDPTSESKEIPSVNVDVDLSSHVFSTFERVNVIKYDDGTNQIWDDVPVGEPQYHFKPKNVYSGTGAIVGTTLDLHCDAYDMTKMSEYCIRRKADPTDPELAKLAPTGYAFKYEYDSDFLTRISVDDRRPDGMQDWEYAIYKTTFSSGLTKSDFKAADLLDFGIHYQDPDATKPNYKEFTWDKSKLDRMDDQYPWIKGGEGFYIQPDVVNGEKLNKGIIFFTGSEITENLFAGGFTDEDAVKACEDYLNATETGSDTKFLHRDFSLKIKATEYFRVETHDLQHTDLMNFEINNPEDPSRSPMLSGNRYSFKFIVDDEVDQMFKDGFELNKFVILDMGNERIPLISELASKAGDDPVEALSLKVLLDSPGNGVSDITRFFKYGVDGTNANAIYYDNTVTSNAVGFLPEKGDIIKFNFTFRARNDGMIEQANWYRAQLNMVKPIETTSKLEDDGSGTYTFISGTKPMVIAKEKTYRFEAQVNSDRYFDTLSFDDGTDPVVLTSEIVKPYIIDKDGKLMSISSDLYSITTDGNLKFDDAKIRRDGHIDSNYKYAVDIRSDIEMAVKTATLTTTIKPREYRFSSYERGEGALTDGYFVMDHVTEQEKAIKSGLILNFNCYIGDLGSKFWESINKLRDSEGSTATLSLLLTDGSGNPIPMGSADFNDFSVMRKYKDETQGQPAVDTSYYHYDDTTKTITAETDYIKGLKSEDGYEYLTFSINYAGAEILMDNAVVTLDITAA